MKRTHLLTALTAAAGGWFAAVSFQPARFATEADAIENPGGAQVSNLRVPAEERRAGSTPTLRSSNARQCPMHPWVKSDKPARCTICGMNLTPARDAMTAGAGHGIVVALRAGSISALDVRTEEARRRPLARTLRVAGMIGENESRHGVICAPVEGRIDALGMSCEGEKLTRHQPMLTLFSRTLLAAAGDYRAALAQGGDAIDQAADRLTKCGLVREQIISIPQRRTDDIHFGILAPLGGTITKSYVAEGQHVREGERLFEVADFATMWFNFVAYEADLPFLEKGQVVQVATPSLPGQITRARIAFINPILDEATRSTRVRVELHNPDGRF